MNKPLVMTEQKTNAGTRIGSMLLDHIAMTFIAMIFFIPGMILGFSAAFEVSHEQTSPDIFGSLSYFGLIGFALYFCKDSINGRSIAKRALKLQVIENSSGRVASQLFEICNFEVQINRICNPENRPLLVQDLVLASFPRSLGLLILLKS
jgi:hypothetical protein